MHFIREILSYAARYKLLSGLFFACMIIEVAYAVAAPLSLKYLVDEAFTPKNVNAFVIILLILLGAGLLHVGANMLGDYALGKLSGRMIRKLRMDLFSHLQRLPLTFYHRYKTGDLVTRFSSDMSSIEHMIQGASPLLLREALSISLGLSVLFSLEWKLTLAMIAGSFLMFVGPKWLQGRAEAANLSSKEAQERFSNTIDEMVKGHKTIRGLHQQQRFEEKARTQINELFTFGFKLHVVNALMERLPLTSLLLLNGIMMGFGGYLIFHDEMTIGGFMAFFTLFLTTGQSLTNLSYLIPNLIESGVSFRRIGELLEQPAVKEYSPPQELPDRIDSIRMEHVTFGYTEDTVQLKDVSVHIPSGTYTAFVGSSGSGKSTALQLIGRFYEPRQGSVFMNGIDLAIVEEASFRKMTALVTQDTFLFNTTVRDNLQLDRTDLTDEEMMDAAKRANIHELISKWPEGYETAITNEGGSLSGGERQRISIARALLRRPKLLLLDEVTSALDPVTEADMNKLIQELPPKCTVISVTHRLASVVNADQIYVFNDGTIVESGTHQQLLAKKGLYSSLWEKQQGFQLSEDGLHAKVEVERLAKLPFFKGIELSLIQNLTGLFATEVYQQGDCVVREGEEGNKFYIIVRGMFEILKKNGDGEDVRVAILQDGDYFGEIALLKEIPRTATVKAAGPSVLLSVRREAFHQLIEHSPQIRAVLEQALKHRM